MYVNVAVLKETQPHERRVAPAPSVAPKLIKLGGNKAKQVYVVKRGEGKGYAGNVNPLFYADNCNMVYGDAQDVMAKMIEAVRGLGAAVAA